MKILLSAYRASVAVCLSALFCSFPFTSVAQGAGTTNEVTIYPATDGLPRSADFTVKVRVPGQEWRDLPAYAVKVSEGIDTRPADRKNGGPQSLQNPLPSLPLASMNLQKSSIASFDFSGSVEVSITCNQTPVETARVRPLSYAISPSVIHNTITFSLSQPRNLSVEVNGNIFRNLQLFANPIESSIPDANDPNVIYFGPGVHQVGRVTVSGGKTVYLAGGALVEGSFLVNHAENVRILGRGILYQPNGPIANQVSSSQSRPQGNDVQAGGASTSETSSRPKSILDTTIHSPRHDAILIEYSKGVEVDGIIEVPNSYSVMVGQSQNVTIRNIKSVSAGGNNDGIDVFASSDILIDGVFLRNSDDNIAIYGHRWGYYGDVRHVIVQNSTLWADVAHPILVGTHGDSVDPDTLEDIDFRNIDILDHREPQLDYQGCMSLDAGDRNLIRNVRFENIRIEDFRQGQLLNLRVFFNKKYNTSPGRGIEDVLFKDVTYNGSHANPSIIEGFDDSREIKNIVFENLTINGTVIADEMTGKPRYFKTADMANIFVGEHVDGVHFIADGQQESPIVER